MDFNAEADKILEEFGPTTIGWGGNVFGHAVKELRERTGLNRRRGYAVMRDARSRQYTESLKQYGTTRQ